MWKSKPASQENPLQSQQDGSCFGHSVSSKWRLCRLSWRFTTGPLIPQGPTITQSLPGRAVVSIIPTDSTRQPYPWWPWWRWWPIRGSTFLFGDLQMFGFETGRSLRGKCTSLLPPPPKPNLPKCRRSTRWRCWKSLTALFIRTFPKTGNTSLRESFYNYDFGGEL